MSEPVNWIIENFSKDFSYIELIAAVKKAGHPLIEVRNSYTRELMRPVLDGKPHCVIFNGSITLSQMVRKDLPRELCEPVIFCGANECGSFTHFLCSRYYPYFGDFLFNDRYVMMPLREFKRQKFMVYGLLGKDALVFIRPDSGEKTFTARLLDFQDICSFCENYAPHADELVLVSTPKNVRWEGRFVVTRNREIVACSTYIMQGQKTMIPSAPKEATDKCHEILSVGYYPDDVFCIDICEGEDGKFYLLELTSFSSAGLYACNKDRIVQVVSESALSSFYKRQAPHP